MISLVTGNNRGVMPKTSTSFKPGQSGNPSGRPKREWTWAQELQKAVERQTADGTPIKEGVADAVVTQALEGNVHAIRELFNRMDGMPHQAVSHTGEDGPIEIKIVSAAMPIPKKELELTEEEITITEYKADDRATNPELS